MAVAAFALLSSAGPIDPPAAGVAPTGKTLGEVEARVAVNATNTPGDEDSLFVITQPGSYYLTGDITGEAGKHGIKIAASTVTLDLNGFSLFGAPGSLDGVHVPDAQHKNISIRNGSVIGWGGHGVNCVSPWATVMRLRASGNAQDGVRVGHESVIDNCDVSDNGGDGAVAQTGASIFNTRASGNGQRGIAAGEGSLIMHCHAEGNAVAGVSGDAKSLVALSLANGNGSADDFGNGGFILTSNCMVINNVANDNAGHGININSASFVTGNVANNNTAGGIIVSSNSMITNNQCSNNGATTNNINAAGILIAGTFFGQSYIGNNTVTGNGHGVGVLSNHNIIVRNTASSNAVNYAINASNIVGVVVAAPSSGPVNGTGGAGVGTTDPWANFSF